MQDTLLPRNQALWTQQDVAVPSKKAISVQRLQSVHLLSYRPAGGRGFNYVMSRGDSDILL